MKTIITPINTKRFSTDWWAQLTYRVRLQAYYMNSNQPHGVESPVIVEHKPI